MPAIPHHARPERSRGALPSGAEASRFARRGVSTSLDANGGGIETLNTLSPEEIARRLSGPRDEVAAFVRAAAEAGSAEAQARFGQMLLDGDGVAADAAQAFDWFERAARAGHLEAANMVGRCYDLGWGVAVDKAQAAAWFRQAAARGLTWAKYNYATLLALGQGVAEDKPTALALFEEAAAEGNAKAHNFVGSFHEDGWVVERDMAEAARRYRLAAEGGDFRGQFNHGRMLARRGDTGEARRWMSLAWENGNARFRVQMIDYLDREGEPLRSAIAKSSPSLLGEDLALIVIPNVLTGDQLRDVRARLDAADWIDGNATSGHQSALAKRNRQLGEDDPEAKALGNIILDALAASPLFVAAALPLKVYPPLFNLYGEGEQFGDHVDSAIRIRAGSDFRIRSDLSATLFLSDPDDYEGGELVAEGQTPVKLPAGDMILYPASTVHHVTPVTRGERRASFFWIQSMVRDLSARSMLFDLDRSIQELSATAGPDAPALVRLTGLYHNLLRRWAEL